MADAQQIITDQVIQLNDIANSLGGLACAFRRTGNHDVADELGAASDQIHGAADAIHDAHYAQRMAESSQSITNSERFVGSILKGLLSGKDPKDACIEAMPHHFDRDIIEKYETSDPSAPPLPLAGSAE